MKKKTLTLFSLFGVAGFLTVKYFAEEPATVKVEEKKSLNPIAKEPTNPSPPQPQDPTALLEQDKKPNIKLNLPEIFSGSSIPDGIRSDKDGNLIVDNKLRLTLDYFTQIMGIAETDQNAFRLRIEEFLVHSLDEPAKSQALDIFSRYWDYSLFVNARQDEEALQQIKDSFQGQYTDDHLAAVQAFRVERDALRDRYFDQNEIAGLFSQERRYETYMDQKMAIATRETDKAEKWLKLAELEQSLPIAEQKARKRMSVMQRYKQFEIIQNDEAVAGRALEDQLFDKEEIEQFKTIRAQRQAWQYKKLAYQEFKKELQDSGLSDSELSIRLDQYMQNHHFSQQEVRRVQALENRLGSPYGNR